MKKREGEKRPLKTWHGPRRLNPALLIPQNFWWNFLPLSNQSVVLCRSGYFKESLLDIHLLLSYEGPLIYDVRTKIGVSTPSPVYMRPNEPADLSPCGRPHSVRKNDPFSRKFFGFWVSCRQIFYISSAKISDDLLLVFSFKKIIFSHVKRNFFNYLCRRSHAPDLPSPFHMRPHWPEPSLPLRVN